MADLTGKAISELPEATAVQSADLFAISQSGASKKITGDTLLKGVTQKIKYYHGLTVNTGSSATSQILQITNSTTPTAGVAGGITANAVVLDCVFANPASISTDVTWTSSASGITFKGICRAQTTANVTIAIC